MSCNNITELPEKFGSVTYEMATPLAFEYPETVSEALKELNDPTQMVPSQYYGVEALTLALKEELYPKIIESPNYVNVLPDYPNFYNRIQVGEISYTEFADFLKFTYYERVMTFVDTMNKNPRKVLAELDNYYGDQMRGQSVDLCSILQNPFAAVQDILGKIDQMNPANILGMIPGIASRLTSFAETMKGLVSNVFDTLKGVVANIGNSLTNFSQTIAKIPAVAAGIVNQFSSQFAALQNMLSDVNLENIKESIDKFVTKAVKQFEKILENPQVVLYLLYMFCKVASSIESSLKSPVDAFKGMVSNTISAQNILKVQSAPVTAAAIRAGRPVATQASVDSVKQNQITSHNSAVAGTNQIPANVNYVHVSQYTTHPDPGSWSNLSFTGKVINNDFWRRKTPYRVKALYGGGTVIPANLGFSPAIGYWGASLEGLERLNNVGKIMGKKLLVTSAFRHPYYNQFVGGANHSKHMQGIAFDVMMNGVNRNEFRRIARSCGFTWMKDYNSFIHVDMR